MFSVIAERSVARVGVRSGGLTGVAVAAVGLLLLSRITVEGSYMSDLLPACS